MSIKKTKSRKTNAARLLPRITPRKLTPQRKIITAEDLSRMRFEKNFVSAILETSGALIVILDPQGRILRLNRAAEEISGYSIMEVIGQFSWELFLIPEERDKIKNFFNEHLPGKLPNQFQSHLKTRNGALLTILWSNTAWPDDRGRPEYIVASGIDITALKKVEAERERLIDQLQEALAKVKTLKGLLPICASCKKIRDDQGYWRMVEDYIHSHSDAEFSHSLCPECAKKLYGDYHKKK